MRYSCEDLQQRIVPRLSHLPLQVEVLSVTDSTNTRLKEEAKAALRRGEKIPFRLLIAQSQTAGRGRLGRSFYSPPGTGLYFSLLLPIDCPWEEANLYTCVMAASLAQAIEQVTDRAAGIKWVNDIYLGGKKACGILTEAASDGSAPVPCYAVIGVGINLTPPPEGFPQELAQIATALWERSPRIDQVAELCIQAVSGFFALRCADFMTPYRQRSLLVGKTVTYTKNGQLYGGKVLGIDDCGGLILQIGETQQVLSCGEVSVRSAGDLL